MEQAGVQLIAQGANVYISDMGNATKATNTFVDTTEEGGGRVSGAGQVMIGALREVGKVVVDVFGKALKATAAFVGDSVDLAGDFQAGMNEFQVAAGKDIDTAGLEKFHDLFLQLGKDLPVSTSDVQQAAIELVKGGLDPATVAAGGLKQAIQFASAAMKGDLVKAAEISSKIVAGWADVNATAADKADLLTHATDLFTKAANASSTDVEQLSRGIFNAQGIAKTAGVSLDDLATTIAELSGDFSSSAEAGTSLKNMIARLQPTTDPAIDAMTGLGLYTEQAGSAFYDAQGNFVGFQQASQLLQDSLKGLTKEQQALALQTIFGNDAMSAAAGLAARGGEGYAQMAESLKNAMGVAEAGATIQSGYNTALENAKGSVEALQISLGEHLLPILTTVLDDYITPGINALSDFADSFFKMVPAIQASDDPLQTFLNALKVAAPSALDVISAIEGVKDALANVVGWFNQAGGAGDDLGSVLDDLNGIWNTALGVVQDVSNGYLAIVQAILPIVGKFWEDHGTQISAFFQTAYDKIMAIVNTALQLYDAIVPKFLHIVAGWIEDHATGIEAVFSGAWDVISGIVDGALTLIEGIFKIALDIINGDWSKAWTDLQDMSAQFVRDIGQVIEGFLNIIAGYFNTNLQEIADLWTNNWNMLIEIVTKIDWVQLGADVVAGIVDGIKDNARKLYDTLSNLASDALQAAKDALGISSPSKEFAAVGQFAVQGLMQGFADSWPALIDQVGSLSADLIDSMRDIGSQIQEVIGDSFGATASIDRQVAKNLDSFKDVLPEYQQYTTGALKAAQGQAEAFLDPAEGAKYFKLRSAQILEYAKLQKDLSEAETQEDRDRISAQMLLINKAQSAELAQFDATKSATSPMEDIANQVNEILKALAGINLTDDQIKVVDMLSGIWASLVTPIKRAAGGPVDSGQPYWVGEQGPELFWPQSNGMISPAASSAQMAARASTTNYNGQVGNTFNMPIYTNQSAQVLQQSWAVLQASMP